jgi:hypothetical protein
LNKADVDTSAVGDEKYKSEWLSFNSCYAFYMF